MSKMTREEYKDLACLIGARFPEAFPEAPRPLAIGIDKAIVKAFPGLSKTKTRLFLRRWCNTVSYKVALSTDGRRFDPDGLVVGAVTAAEREHALKELAAYFYERRNNPDHLVWRRARRLWDLVEHAGIDGQVRDIARQLADADRMDGKTVHWPLHAKPAAD